MGRGSGTGDRLRSGHQNSNQRSQDSNHESVSDCVGGSVCLSEIGSGDTVAAPLSGDLKIRLSLMMFLQYAIWGAWLPLLWSLLTQAKGFDGARVGNIFAVGAVGAIIGPFIAGQVADRWFNTEKFLAISHICQCYRL